MTGIFQCAMVVVEHKLILRGISRQGNHSWFPWQTTWQEFNFSPKGSGTVKGETELYYLTIFSAMPFGVLKLLTSLSKRNSLMSFIDMSECVRNPAISHSPLKRNRWYGLILWAPASSLLWNHPRNLLPESNTWLAWRKECDCREGCPVPVSGCSEDLSNHWWHEENQWFMCLRTEVLSLKVSPQLGHVAAIVFVMWRVCWNFRKFPPHFASNSHVSDHWHWPPHSHYPAHEWHPTSNFIFIYCIPPVLLSFNSYQVCIVASDQQVTPEACHELLCNV